MARGRGYAPVERPSSPSPGLPAKTEGTLLGMKKFPQEPRGYAPVYQRSTDYFFQDRISTFPITISGVDVLSPRGVRRPGHALFPAPS